MVLDYSKWDKIELSDDSDIEVHPNVDKRSFINAKRRQIHEQRNVRKQNIANLKTERTMNSVLLERLTKLISYLESQSGAAGIDDGLVLHALIDIASEESKDEHPVPEGTPSYTKMMASLVDTVKKEVDQEKATDYWKTFLEKLRFHRGKIIELQKSSAEKLADLEKEEGAKITSDSIQEGFSSGHVTKPYVPGPSEKKKKKTVTQKVQAVEQLNPGAGPPQNDSISSGAEADVEEAAEEEDEEHIEPTPLGREFSKIKIGDYQKCLNFIGKHPEVVAEKETDGLLIEAFNLQLSGKEDYAKQCVHQALLLQYCRQLGRDGVGLFFKRITTANHQAQKVFHDDVTSTYNRIRTRAAELSVERAKEDAGVEQIQLHAVDPNTTINIAIPPWNPENAEEKAAREVFEAFPPGLQRALETGSLDEVNKILGKMSVEEAEEVVGQLGESGMLSLESQILDATTKEGQQKLKKLEEDEKESKERAKAEKLAEEKGKGKEKATEEEARITEVVD